MFLFDYVCMRFHGEGVMLAEEAHDRLRKLAENCNNLDGFQLTHSIGGGCGSGVGSRILLKLRDVFPQNMLVTFTVFPTPTISNIGNFIFFYYFIYCDVISNFFYLILKVLNSQVNSTILLFF